MMHKTIKIAWQAGVSALFMLTFMAQTEAQTFKQTGVASFYADKFVGRTTANGEKYRHNKLTAAHKSLPFGTMVKVRNLENNREVVVRINDRGPFVEGRIIDLSKSAAQKLDFVQKGIVRVEISTVGAADQSKQTYSSLDRPLADEAEAPKEYYSLSVEKSNLSGFGVQIGSFTEMVNLVELADGIKRSQKSKVYVQVSVIQGVKYYKLILGSLANRDKAEKLKNKVVKDYPDSFVIKF
jgi:rare lipoprotein A